MLLPWQGLGEWSVWRESRAEKGKKSFSSGKPDPESSGPQTGPKVHLPTGE